MTPAGLLASLKKQVDIFSGILKNKGYFYDINQLHLLFRYSRKFSSETVREKWGSFLRFRNNGRPGHNAVDFYIHIPFCRSKCAYCLFPSWKLEGPEVLDRYVGFLIDEMHFFSRTFSHIKFRNLYIGGGTPSILSNAQLNKILSNLFKYFSFEEDGQRTSECNPHSAKNENFHTLRKFGFNRISFGVQSLNMKALKVNKRQYQNYARIRRSVALARKSGFKDINIDLIAGLAGDDLNNFKRSFSRIAQLRPYNIVVYGLMPPNDAYLNGLLRMGRERYFGTYYPKMISRALKIMEALSGKFGYVPDSLDPARWHWGFRHKDYLSLFDLDTYSGEYAECTFGLGCFSRSHIRGLLEYRQNIYPEKFKPDAEIFEGRNFSLKEEMVKFVINQIDRDSKVNQKSFREMFGIRLTGAFPYAIYALKALKKIKITRDYIYFCFRRPEEKYIYTLFFFRNIELDNKFSRGTMV